MAIENTEITTAGDDIFLCPGTLPSDSREYAVTCVIFCNVSGSDTTLTLHAIPQSSSLANVNMIINALTIPAGETFTFDTEKMVLATGDTLHAIAGNDGRLVATVTSMRVS